MPSRMPNRVAPACVELLFERIEAAKRRRDGLRDISDRRAARARPHDLPEHRVIDVPAAIVAHGGADVLRNNGAIVGQQLLNGLIGQIRAPIPELCSDW